ncbi:GD19498 [Drosophila simulans]|uniref:GD19498 n=1 Tax=Drosophila simulans TaxID=7240 RepID=B4NVH2_DROSI|nr:GD19498 [Drosophila simulans]
MFGTSFSHNFFAQRPNPSRPWTSPVYLASGFYETALMKLESQESSPKNIGSSVNKSQ